MGTIATVAKVILRQIVAKILLGIIVTWLAPINKGFLTTSKPNTTIRTRLYYFPNSRKHALFGTYLQVQFHGISPASHASTKNVFKNVFTEDRFETCYIFWRATALFKDMYDVAFTDNSIPHAVQEVQSKKQLKQHLIIACWKCYNSIDILPRQS